MCYNIRMDEEIYCAKCGSALPSGKDVAVFRVSAEGTGEYYEFPYCDPCAAGAVRMLAGDKEED